MPFDTIIVVIPKMPQFGEWLQEWSDVLDRQLDMMDGLAIVASWLNSAPVRGLHIIGRVPTPAGAREFTKALADEIQLPRATQAENFAILRDFVQWAVNWRERPADNCFDPLGTDIDNRLRALGGWNEPQYGGLPQA